MTRPFFQAALTFILTLLLSTKARPQDNGHPVLINVGLSEQGYGYPSSLNEAESSVLPTINIYADYSFNKLFSIAPYGAYTYSYYKFSPGYRGSGYTDAWTGWDVGLRYTLHLSPVFIKKDNEDLYLTAFTGYTTRRLVFDKENIYRDSLNYRTHAISIGGIVGFRYSVSKRAGIYAEAGLSRKFFIGVGFSYKFLER